MMRAIRAVSVERGRDPRDFALLAFGGNGPLFAAGIAAELGIARVIVPPMPGLFSAFGLLLADTEHHASRFLRNPDAATLGAALHALVQDGFDRLAEDGFPPERRTATVSARARYAGQSSDLAFPLPDLADPAAILEALPEAFAAEHERSYGFRAPPGEPVELTGLSVIARGTPDRERLPDRIAPARIPVPARRRAWFPDLGWIDTEVFDRAALATGARTGPLIVQEYDATCLVPPDGSAALDGFGNIVVTLGAGSVR
jgi:N-methylhydantoinase A